ncbi:uncharacterized protein UTRI_01338 [Ustilago trichophora]|uniref:Uncharacterized protein n=1 Tax=Ustilago trichophora TaxID=86804 RepID=A0A5C3DY88_9BASI|nr:uncharacterized protein UTRI_01338 [Ustilago trichophora]
MPELYITRNTPAKEAQPQIGVTTGSLSTLQAKSEHFSAKRNCEYVSVPFVLALAKPEKASQTSSEDACQIGSSVAGDFECCIPGSKEETSQGLTIYCTFKKGQKRKRTAAPRIPAWSPTAVLTRRYLA